MQITIDLDDMPMGHRLPAHEGACRFLHGHNYKIRVAIIGPVEENGMVMDFSHVKHRVKAILADFDHAMCLYEGDQFAHLLQDKGQKLITIDAPPTAENLAVLWQGMLAEAFPDSWVGVTVFETSKCAAITFGGERRVYVTHLSDV